MLIVCRVSRDELYSQPGSPTSSPDHKLLEAFRSKAGDYVAVNSKDQAAIDTVNGNEAENDLVSFRLSASKPSADRSAKPTQTVRIRSPSAELKEPGFVNRKQPETIALQTLNHRKT